ncbi:aminoglycoside phosphotransferase family protein [Roseibium porphyridii]|uniref:Aminoglycoside phosphotransferase family protein n=1 Tax=Roseibium porphyridii TaxID=2866279 RepID=A0ABY8FEB2_9HYPH|nr:aminoglycoside phosphotransferase family protein [Roseibium sp. KMA01]WFE91580.1 aminoglycoside phosphotransferase family protein [Roseibium sp. KMA01]
MPDQQDELPSDDGLLRQLLDEHAPQWSGLKVRPVASGGTDNALYRIGEERVARLPKRASAVGLLQKEADWLPRLSGLALNVPVVRFRKRPGAGCEHGFAIYDWIEGVQATPDALVDQEQAARDLAVFLKGLQGVLTDGAPHAGESNHKRGAALEELTDFVLSCIDVLADEIDAGKARSFWQMALQTPFEGPAKWLHGDLKADNLIASEGRLTAVIDWGLTAVGDPAADFAAAWSWVLPASRETFRETAGVSDPDWCRARAWALHNAVIALSYYRGRSHEGLCRQSRQTLSRLGLLRVASN